METKLNWLKNNIDKYSYKDLTKNYNKAFEDNLSINQIRYMCEKNNIIKKVKCFKKNSMAFKDEWNDWLKENYLIDNIAEEFYKKFGVKKTSRRLRDKACRLGYRFANKREEQRKFIIANYNKYLNLEDLAKIYNKKFNDNIDGEYIRRRAKHWKLKRTIFNRYHKTSPLGTEQKSGQNTFIKVSDKYNYKNKQKNYMLKSRYMYEKHYNVKLTNNDVITFLDGNHHNFSKDNLLKLDKKTFVKVSSHSFIGKGKLTLAAVELTKTFELLDTIK